MAQRIEDEVSYKIIGAATEVEHAIHKAQLLTYLRLTGIKLGLLINFGQDCVKDGIQRVVNGLYLILCAIATLLLCVLLSWMQYMFICCVYLFINRECIPREMM